MGRRPQDNPPEFNDVTIRIKFLAESGPTFWLWRVGPAGRALCTWGWPLRTATSSDRHQREMPPKQKAEVFWVDGVACSVTKAKDQGTAYVTIGTSGFSNAQRIMFRLSQLPGAASREDQVRTHKGWPALLEASRLKGVESGGGSAQACAREESAGERPASSLRSGCVACEDDDCEAALNSTDGRFYCAACVDDPANEDSVSQAAAEQLAAREAAAAQQPPVPPSPELRWSPREVKFVSRLEPEWSAYAVGRTGERHACTRDESYTDVQAARKMLRAAVEAAALENADLASHLASIYRRLRELAAPGAPGEAGLAEQCEAAAAVLLREAILELTQDWDRRRREEAREEVREEAREEAREESAPESNAEAPKAHAAGGVRAATPRWAASRVRVGGVNGTDGELCIDAPYLSWTPTSGASDEPTRVDIRNVLYADIEEDDDVRHSRCCASGARVEREWGASGARVRRDCEVIDCNIIAQSAHGRFAGRCTARRASCTQDRR